jgi:hypothetical protein
MGKRAFPPGIGGEVLTINPSRDPHNGVVSFLYPVRRGAARQRYAALIAARISPRSPLPAGECRLTMSRFALFSFDTLRRIRILRRPRQYFEGKFRRSPGACNPLSISPTAKKFFLKTPPRPFGSRAACTRATTRSFSFVAPGYSVRCSPHFPRTWLANDRPRCDGH